MPLAYINLIIQHTSANLIQLFLGLAPFNYGYNLGWDCSLGDCSMLVIAVI